MLMETSKLFCCVLCLALFLTSCDIGYGKFVHWKLFLQTKDTITVDYPTSILKPNGRYVYSCDKVDFETIEVKKDTFIVGDNVTSSEVDFTNIEVHITRQTNHDAVKILFIRNELLPLNISYIQDGKYMINQQALDSMMNLYGVILPIDQEQITVPILTRLN